MPDRENTTAGDAPALPSVVDRASFQAELEALRAREKAHTREGDAIAAARRRLPMVEVDAGLELLGPAGPLTLLDAFEGRRQLIAYYFMWWPGRPAPDQCEGCTMFNGQLGELSYLHSRDITYAVFSQGRNVTFGGADPKESYDESVRYRDFMGWELPWYSAQPSLDALLVGREVGLFHLVCYLRDGDRVFETYWTRGRGVESMDYSLALMDRTVYGRQEPWEDSPAGWPQQWSVDGSQWRTGGRPIAQWSRLEAGHSDDLGSAGTDSASLLARGRAETRLPTQDLARARRYYSEQLGLEPVDEAPGGLLYRCGGAEFQLYQSVGASPGTFTQLSWEVDDIEAVVAELKRRGVVFEEVGLLEVYGGARTTEAIADVDGYLSTGAPGPQRARGAWFRDSEGNMLGIGQPVAQADPTARARPLGSS